MPLAFFHYSSQHKPFTFVERESAPMHIFWETITFFLRRITLVLNGCQNEESCVAVTGGYGGITFCFLLFVSIVYPRLFNSTECIKPGHKPHTLKKKKKSADDPQSIFIDYLLSGRPGSCTHRSYLSSKSPFQAWAMRRIHGIWLCACQRYEDKFTIYSCTALW